MMAARAPAAPAPTISSVSAASASAVPVAPASSVATTAVEACAVSACLAPTVSTSSAFPPPPVVRFWRASKPARSLRMSRSLRVWPAAQSRPRTISWLWLPACRERAASLHRVRPATPLLYKPNARKNGPSAESVLPIVRAKSAAPTAAVISAARVPTATAATTASASACQTVGERPAVLTAVAEFAVPAVLMRAAWAASASCRPPARRCSSVQPAVSRAMIASTPAPKRLPVKNWPNSRCCGNAPGKSAPLRPTPTASKSPLWTSATATTWLALRVNLPAFWAT